MHNVRFLGACAANDLMVTPRISASQTSEIVVPSNTWEYLLCHIVNKLDCFQVTVNIVAGLSSNGCAVNNFICLQSCDIPYYAVLKFHSGTRNYVPAKVSAL